MLLTPTQSSFFALIILSFGSFAALFTVRWPRLSEYLWQKEAHNALGIPFEAEIPESISTGRSRCESCHHTLSWKDLIPILSYGLLQGRCRYCQMRISPHYVLIESTCLCICLPLLITCHDLIELSLNSLLMCSLLTAAIIDYQHKLIPDECCLIALAAALLLNIHSGTLENAVLGMIVGYSAVYLLRWGYLKIRNIEAIGLGDVKLLATLGAWLGVLHLTTLLLYASLIGILYILLYREKNKEPIPFGPFLFLSGIIHYYYLNL
ncbi:Type 4 prepilin-like proteins leader peptide-processing enzyme [Marinomonas spartinae]|uniref:Prepilin leader peptidase/N-methyltransferase n=1 Tax=Marinomonas spartinae TaxID=1792290 RepID=A0A1A8TLN4_9GAMM|nr:A24 family peptidase [Marinomonas spartinae]SBS34558.1 Type 4 prepilin-like proteins leader peptide-processing enzyme [Marinomonas spartinae]